MPGKIKLRIVSARNLPIMDRSSDSSDAFVEVRFGANNYDKTHVHKKSLDPEWNSRFVFEVEEYEIQEEPLQIRYNLEKQFLIKAKFLIFFLNIKEF